VTVTRSAKKFRRIKRDHYPTHESVVDALLEVRTFRKTICDPCCGPKRQILEAVSRHGHRPVGCDLVLGYDFIKDRFRWRDCDIVSNPPYGDRQARLATAFVERALEVVAPWGGQVAMLLPADFDSGHTRRHLFRDCRAFSATVVLLNRVRIFDNKSGTTNHSWFCWRTTKRDHEPSEKFYSHISYGD
jgi:hypothetical protein